MPTYNISKHPRTGMNQVTVGAAQYEANSVGVVALASEALKVATVTLTDTNIKALRATPITIVSAPGAGFGLEFISVVLLLDYGGAAYTESADNLAVRYTDGSGVIVSQAIEMTNFIDATGDTVTVGLPKIDPIVAKAGISNVPLVLHNTGDGEFGGGHATSVIRVRTTYRVHTLGF